MGNQRQYVPGGDFTEYLYETIGKTVVINGMKCSIVRLKGDLEFHSSLPFYSKTSDAYVNLGKDGKPKQIRLFKDRKSWKDFDWGHTHKNKDGSIFPKGVVHVQRFQGVNSKDARFLTADEIKNFGDIIHHFAPGVKFQK